MNSRARIVAPGCRSPTRVWLIFLLIVSVYACSSSGTKQSNAPTNYPEIVWPEKPARPRIAFKQVVRRATDLGIEKSFFEKIGDFFLGEKNISLVRPIAVVVLQDGTLFVADPGVGGVHRLSVKHGEHEILMLKDNKPLSTPVALAVNNDKVYLSDSTLGVFIIEPGDNYVRPLELKEPPKRPTGMAFDSKTGNLFISDTVKHNIKVYDNKGNLIKVFGKRGTGDGEFNYPSMLWMGRDGLLYVADSLNFRTQIFTSDGQFVRKFGQMGDSTGQLSRPKGIATDRYGHIYIVDSLFHSVQIFNQQGDFLINFGRQGADYGEFWLPTGIFIDDQDGTTIYVADTYNQRLQIFRYVGGEG